MASSNGTSCSSKEYDRLVDTVGQFELGEDERLYVGDLEISEGASHLPRQMMATLLTLPPCR